jgi:hypothetical protein
MIFHQNCPNFPIFSTKISKICYLFAKKFHFLSIFLLKNRISQKKILLIFTVIKDALLIFTIIKDSGPYVH